MKAPEGPPSTDGDGESPRTGRRLPAQQRRDQLLAVARQKFADDGYWPTTALAVARAAGVSEKLVLTYFGSKEGLFRAAVIDPLLDLLRGRNQQSRATLDAGVRREVADHRDTVRRMLRDWTQLVKKEGPTLLAFLSEVRHFPDEARSALRLLAAEVEQSAQLTARAAGGRDEYRDFDAEVAAYASLAMATVAALAGKDAEAMIDHFLDMIFLGILTENGRSGLSPL